MRTGGVAWMRTGGGGGGGGTNAVASGVVGSAVSAGVAASTAVEIYNGVANSKIEEIAVSIGTNAVAGGVVGSAEIEEIAAIISSRDSACVVARSTFWSPDGSEILLLLVG